MNNLQKLLMISAFMATILVLTGCQPVTSNVPEPPSELPTNVAPPGTENEQLNFEQELEKMDQHLTFDESGFEDGEIAETVIGI